MPRNLELIGVSSSVRDSDVAHANDTQQDVFIREVAADLSERLRKFVGGARFIGEPLFQVTGPHTDPLQGIIHVHTFAAYFDLDALPTDCDAYRVHVTERPTAPDTNGPIIIQGNRKA